MRNAKLVEAHAGIKIARMNIIISDMQMIPPFWEKVMKVKAESEKAGLKLNIRKKKIMASGPITSWQIDGDTMETLIGFFFWGSKITRECQRVLKLPHNCAHLTC